MSYRIAYSPEKNSKYPLRKERKFGYTWIVTIAAVALALLGIIGVHRENALKSLLLPGNPVVTEAALKTMVTDIRGGEPVADAFTAFCREIIENANLPD